MNNTTSYSSATIFPSCITFSKRLCIFIIFYNKINRFSNSRRILFYIISYYKKIKSSTIIYNSYNIYKLIFVKTYITIFPNFLIYIIFFYYRRYTIISMYCSINFHSYILCKYKTIIFNNTRSFI